MATFVAIWAVVEFLFDFRIYQDLPPVGLENLAAIWQSIQIRDGRARSEAAFGTSIALAAFLAAALPYVLRLRGKKLLATSGVLLAGIFFTLSRTGFIAVGVVAVLTIIGRRQRHRLVLIAAGAAATWLLLPLVEGDTVSRSTAQELQESSEYRDFVFSNSIDASRWIGPSSADFISVDNAYLRIALEAGLVPAILLATLFAYTLWIAVRHRPGPAAIAATAMGAAMLVVALITQWELFVFAALGAAASEIQLSRVAPVRKISASNHQ